MSNVVFDYSALSDAKTYAKNIVTGLGCMDFYKDELNRKLVAPLDEWKLSGNEPYGRGYIISAKQCIVNKQNNLREKRQQWIVLSDNLGKFLQYLKDTEKNVVNIFLTTSSAYVNYSGVGGFFNRVGDYMFNIFAVDLANSNGLTRAIFDWGKRGADNLSYYKQQADDWFQHGDGRYVLHIIGSFALATLAVVGVVAAFVGLPFTGGASCTVAAACIGILVLVAESISAGITFRNTKYALEENFKALNMQDDPAMARFHGDVSRYSDYVKKTDFGSAEENQKAENVGKNLDRIQAVTDLISLSCGGAMNFCTRTTKVYRGTREVDFMCFDFRAGNIKNNVLKTFGFKLDKSTAFIDEAGIIKSKRISNIDDLGNSSLKIMRGSQNTTFKAAAFKKTAEIVDGKQKIAKALRFDKFAINTEYGCVIASNGVLTQEVAAYGRHAAASSTTFDFTNAVSSAKKVREAEHAGKPYYKLKMKLNNVEDIASAVSETTSYLQTSDESKRRNMLMSGLLKENYFISQVDKYIYQYDANEGKGYFLGDFGKSVDNLWKVMTEN